MIYKEKTFVESFPLLDVILSGVNEFIEESAEHRHVFLRLCSGKEKQAVALADPHPCKDIVEWASGKSGLCVQMPFDLQNRGKTAESAIYAEIDLTRPRDYHGADLIDGRDLANALEGAQLPPSVVVWHEESRKAYVLWAFDKPYTMTYKERGTLLGDALNMVLPESWADVPFPSAPFYIPLDAQTVLKTEARYTPQDFRKPSKGGGIGGAELTIEALREELAARELSVRFNEIKAQIDIDGKAPDGRALDLQSVETLLYSDLIGKYRKVSFDAIGKYLRFIADSNSYNPVLDVIRSAEWDGTDRIKGLFELLQLPEGDLSRTLLQKWLYQGIALLMNDGTHSTPFGAAGVLVLVGEQGAGKTSFFRALAMRPEWFAEGQHIDERDKDTSRRLVTAFVSEMGEVGSTLKSDQDKLKAFVTKAVDTYRLQYGRHDEERNRRANLCATCNDMRYLVDETGNRRWFTVPLPEGLRIAHEQLEEPAFNALQIWAQAYAEVMALTAAGSPLSSVFRLDPDEEKELTERNRQHEKPLKGEDEVLDILAEAERDGLQWREMTINEWLEEFDILKRYGARHVGKILTKHGLEEKKTRSARMRALPSRRATFGIKHSNSDILRFKAKE